MMQSQNFKKPKAQIVFCILSLQFRLEKISIVKRQSEGVYCIGSVALCSHGAKFTIPATRGSEGSTCLLPAPPVAGSLNGAPRRLCINREIDREIEG